MVDIEDSSELRAYLMERLGTRAPGETVAESRLAGFTFEILSGGVSNRTVRVAFPTGTAWVIKQALDKLRVPIDWFCSPERIHREALGMQLLGSILPRGSVPRMVFEDRANYILAMEAVREPFSNWKRALLEGRLRFHTVKRFARLLSAIHVGGFQGRDSLPEELFDLTFFWNLRLEPYYRFTAAAVSEARALLEGLVDGYETKHLTLVHGDFSPKNILLRHGRPILLDHEVIHVGDPAFDVGFSLTHLLSKAHHLRHLRIAFARAANLYWSTYLAATPHDALKEWGSDFEQRAVRHTLGCLLARSAGRSQLEYLSADEKTQQVRAVLELISGEPQSIPELVSRFLAALGSREPHGRAGRTVRGA